MSLDSIARERFPFIVGTMIALAAYFQASAMNRLVAFALVQDAEPGSPGAEKTPPSTIDPSDRRDSSATAILERNPFDAKTGPLLPPPLAVPTPALGGEPLCDGARVVLIAVSEDPDWSFAAIEAEDGRTELRRRGGQVGGRTIEEISWNRVRLRAGEARCRLQLGKLGNKEDRESGAKQTSPPPTMAPPPSRSPTSKGDVPADIAAQIRKVSDTEFRVERSVVERVVAQHELITNTSNVAPDIRGGQVVGLKFWVKPGSLLESVGLQSEDTVKSINGIELNDPQRAMEAFSRFRTDSRVSVSIERNGRPVTLMLNVR